MQFVKRPVRTENELAVFRRYKAKKGLPYGLIQVDSKLSLPRRFISIKVHPWGDEIIGSDRSLASAKRRVSNDEKGLTGKKTVKFKKSMTKAKAKPKAKKKRRAKKRAASN